METTRRLLDVDQVRDRLGGISRTVVYDLMKQGHIKRVKIGRSTRIDEASVNNYVARLASHDDAD